jgi:hypothetical protein
MSFCIECGAKLEAADRFCPECGAAVEHPDVANASSLPEQIGGLFARAYRKYWIGGSAGCAVLALLVLYGLYWLGSQEETPPVTVVPLPPLPQAPVSVPAPPVIEAPPFRWISHRDYLLEYEIPTDWVESGENGAYRIEPPAGHPDKGLVWMGVSAIQNGPEKDETEVATAMAIAFQGLSKVKIDNMYPFATRPGGEQVRGDAEVAEGDAVMLSTVIDFHYSDGATGRRWRGVQVGTYQQDGFARFHYFITVRAADDRWSDFEGIGSRLLGLKVGVSELNRP